jgi:hypothetical protein
MEKELPISHLQLRGLFEHLDRASMDGYECDHTFALTERFLDTEKVAKESALGWLQENGAGCDCEVMFNVAAEWEDIVGYVPPDDEET